LRGDRAANDCAGHGTRNETTATAAVTVIAATAATAIDTATAAAKPRAGRTATTDDATAATIKPRGNCSAAATTTGSAADSPLPGAGRRLGEAFARQRHRRDKRNGCGGTQNLQADHYWLHLRDIAQPFQRVDVPEPAHQSCAALNVPDRNCMPDEQIALIPRQLAAKPASNAAPPDEAGRSGLIWTIRPADGIRASALLEPAIP